jgi:hypothetical protein
VWHTAASAREIAARASEPTDRLSGGRCENRVGDPVGINAVGDEPPARGGDRGQPAQKTRGAAFFADQAKIVAQQQDRVEDAQRISRLLSERTAGQRRYGAK